MSVSRREFLAGVPAFGAALTFGLPARPTEGAGTDSQSGAHLQPGFVAPKSPVVSFHLDRPYLDITGLDTPYIPPAGMRGGAPLASLSDEELSRFYGFI